MANVAELVLQLKGKDDLSKSVRDASGELDNFEKAARDADAAGTNLDTTWDRLQAGVDELGNKLDEVSEKIKREDIAAQVADSFGNTERVLIGVSDQLGVLEEKFGLPVGPAREWAQAGADVAGGMEGIIAGGSGLIKTFGPLLTGLGAQIAATWAHVTALTAQAVAMIAANWPILAIIAAIALLAAGVFFLIKHWDTITEKVPILGAAFEVVKGVLDSVLSFITDDLIPGLTAIWQDGLQPILDFAMNNWPIIASLIFLPFAPLILIASDAFGIRSKLLGAFEDIIGFASDKLGKIGEFFTNLTDGPVQWLIDRVWQLINAIRQIPTPSEMLGGVAGKVGGGLGKIPGFATGGVVPGPVGAPMLALVHGGEEVLTPEQRRQGGSSSGINFNGPINIYEAKPNRHEQLNDVAFAIASALRSRGVMVPA